MAETIIITDGFTLNPGDLSWDNIASLGKVRYYDRTPDAEVSSRCAEATIIVTNKTPVTRETIRQATNLKLIAVTATGYNIIDTVEAKANGVTVCNVPGYGTDSVAQHTFALILELTNHVGRNAESVRRGEWSSSPDFCYTTGPLMELAGKTLGVVGYGQIGQKVADLGRAFGMKILYTRSGASRDPGAVSVAEVFSQSDIVTLHCPLTPDNAGFVSLSLLKTMKKDAFLINTARGQLINEADLATALRDGIIKGAGLDVLTKEPPPESNPLIGAPNCVITPHNAWYTPEARKRIMEMTFTNIRAFLQGKPHNVVG